MTEVMSGDSWSYKTCQAPVKSSPSTNQHPTFYRPDALLSSCHPTSSVRALKGDLLTHHHLRLAPLRVRSATGHTNSLQSGRFWATLTASVHVSIVFIQVIRGRPDGLFQYTEGEEITTCSASTLSSIRAICPNRVRCHVWIISVSKVGWSGIELHRWRRTDVGGIINNCHAQRSEELESGASTPYKRWNKCTMEKVGGKRFCRNLRGEVH